MKEEEIDKYSNLIHSLTHYFEGYKNKEDLYQVGIIGLIEAYNKFDDSYNVKFSTYAYKYILGEMKKLVREDKGIKISRNITKLNYQIEKAKIILSQKLCREPNTYELSEFLEVEEYEIIEALKTINIMQSIDEPINNEGKEVTLHDVVSDNSMDLNTLIALKEELNNLTPFERELINKRYMDDLSQSEVANILGLTQVKVSREEAKIKRKIKEKLAV
ncbi:MAG: sigma-70 family RNA polymerase sigma factor [Lactobacillales bacterium]|nr:sigma-70 family RNA polymerase sigma factor [Lactobacillales bacterium]